MRHAPLLSFFVSLLLGACSGADDRAGKGEPAPGPPGPVAEEPAPAAPATRGLVATSCRFSVPRSIEGKTLRCADLLVPENRDKPSSRTIKVHVAIFKGKEGGVPTIELNGGPGASSEMTVGALAAGSARAQAEYGRFLALGDLVLFDQRGVGRSDPALSCGGGVDAAPSVTCPSDLASKGIDLTGYVTSEIADDVHDLKTGLGAQAVNLHGISYGTRLALEILRRHPADVNATVVDGVVPAQAKLLTEGSRNIDAVLTRTFEACAADAKCAATYPDLDATLSAVKAKLDATPFQSVIFGRYDWYAYSGDLFQRLYADGTAGRIPFELHDLATKTQEQFAADETRRLDEEEKAYLEYEEALASTPLGRELSERIAADPGFEAAANDFFYGMYMSVLCSDHGQYESLAEALAADAKVRPELQDRGAVEQAFAACEAWPKRARSAAGLLPIASAKPVLVVGGEVDPATPYRWAADAAKTLAGSQLIEMKGGAHGAMDGCALDLKLGFLATAHAVDASCTGTRTLAFYYPAPPGFAQHADPSAAARASWVREPASVIRAINAASRGPLRAHARSRTRAAGASAR